MTNSGKLFFSVYVAEESRIANEEAVIRDRSKWVDSIEKLLAVAVHVVIFLARREDEVGNVSVITERRRGSICIIETPCSYIGAVSASAQISYTLLHISKGLIAGPWYMLGKDTVWYGLSCLAKGLNPSLRYRRLAFFCGIVTESLYYLLLLIDTVVNLRLPECRRKEDKGEQAKA